MPDVIIKFIADTSSLQEAQAQVNGELGKISGTPLQAVAEKFDQVTNSATKAGEGIAVLSDGVKNLSSNTAIGNLKTQWDGFNGSIKDSIESATSIRGQLRQVTDELTRMRLAGKEGTKAFTDLTAKASELKTATIETQKQLAITGSQTPGLTSLVKATEGVVGAFSIAQGAAALFGDKNKDLEKTLIQVQGAMLILNGLTAVATALEDAAAISAGIYGTVMQGVTFIVEEFAAASATAWAIATAGITLLIAGVVYLASVLSDNSDELERNKKLLNEIDEQRINDTKFYSKLAEEGLQKEIDIAKAKGENAINLYELEKKLSDKRIADAKDLLEDSRKGTQAENDAANLALQKANDDRITLTAKYATDIKAQALKDANDIADAKVLIDKEGTQKQLKDELAALETAKEIELNNINLTTAEKVKIEDKYLSDKLKLNTDYQIKLIQINEKGFNNQAEAQRNSGLISEQEYQNQLFTIKQDANLKEQDLYKNGDSRKIALQAEFTKNFLDNEKQNADYILKLRNETIDAGIALEAPGLQKEIDTIKQNFSKKIEEIKGEGAAEVKLREDLLDEQTKQILAATIKSDETIALQRLKDQQDEKDSLLGVGANATQDEKIKQQKLKNAFDTAQAEESIQSQAALEQLNAHIINEDEYNDITIKARTKTNNALNALDQARISYQQKIATEEKALAEKAANNLLDIANNLSHAKTDELVKASDAQAAKEIAIQQRLLDSKQISQAQFDASTKKANEEADKRDKKLKHDQAVRDKQTAEFKIILATAVAIAEALKYLPDPAPAAIAAATGAVELALVASKAIPLAKGTEYLMGGTDGRDSIPTILMPGERVVPTHINKALAGIMNHELPELAVIHDMKTNTMKTDFIGKPIGYGSEIDYKLLAGHISEAMGKQLREMPRASISINEKGIQVIALEGTSEIEYVNKRYHSH